VILLFLTQYPITLSTIITYLTINSNKFTLNKNEYGILNAGHIKMVCQIRGFYFREGQYGRIGTRSNSRADANDCLSPVHIQITISKRIFTNKHTFSSTICILTRKKKLYKDAIITDKCNIYP